jgi:hypothetical protein
MGQYGGASAGAGFKLWDNIKTDGVWDAKPAIYKEFGLDGNSVTRTVDGLPLRSDIFGNIIYGVMLAESGVDESVALAGANTKTPDSGVSDEKDDVAVSLGYKMVAEYPNGFESAEQWTQFIIENRKGLATQK